MFINHVLPHKKCFYANTDDLYLSIFYRIVEAVILFFEKMSFCSAEEVVNSLSTNKESLLFTPWDTESYYTSKCSVIVRVLDLISQILQTNSKNNITALLENSTLWRMLATCVFHPARLGFDLRTFTIKNNLRNNLIEFLGVLQKSLSLSELSDLHSELGIIISTMQIEVFDNLREILRNDSVTEQQKQFVQGLEILQTSKMLCKLENGSRFNGTIIVQGLFQSMIEEHGDSVFALVLEKSSQELAELLMKFAFLLHADVENILESIKNTTVIKNSITKVSLFHGEHFFMTLKNVILDYLLQECRNCAVYLLQDIHAENVHWVLNIFTELLQQLVKVHNRKEIVNSLVEVIVDSWCTLSKYCGISSERVNQLLGLLINLAKLMGNSVGLFRNHDVVCNWVFMQLTSQQLQLHHKARALDVLVCLTGPQDDTNFALERALQSFQEQHMPCMSVDFGKTNQERIGFIPAFKRILQALEDSGSNVLLRCIVSMAARETKHVCEDEIQNSLQKFITRLDFKNQVKAVEVVFKLFLDEQYDPDIRLNCALRFIQPLLQGCKPIAAREFYKSNINMLLNLVSVGLEKRGGITVEHQLVGKTGAWCLLELMFVHLDCTEFESKECVITAAAFPGGVQTGKELISDLSTRAYNYRKEKVSDTFTENTRIIELFRKSQCASFNALVAIISNTKTDVKFYTGLIFSINSATKEYAWKSLVDCNRSYMLSLDWAEIPKRRKHLISIRREAQSHRRQTFGNVSQTVRYIPSVTQYLFDSTLNEDVTMFDLSTSVVCAEAVGEEIGSEGIEINLEADDLNQHECMATICGMIRHMVDRGISAVPDPGSVVDKLPPWMLQLQKCLDDSKQSHNVRLFLMKVIINTEKKFRPYAHLLMNTMLKVRYSFCNNLYSIDIQTSSYSCMLDEEY